MCYNCVFYLLHTCILFTVIILFSLFRELASWIWCWFSSNYSRSTYILSWFAVLSFHYLYTFWKDGAYLKWEKRVIIVCLVFIIIITILILVIILSLIFFGGLAGLADVCQKIWLYIYVYVFSFVYLIIYDILYFVIYWKNIYIRQYKLYLLTSFYFTHLII